MSWLTNLPRSRLSWSGWTAYNDIQSAPSRAMTRPFRCAMAALFAIQFCSWSAMFTMWIYAVPLVAANVAHVPLDGSGLQGVLVMVSLGYATYAVLGTLGSFALPAMVRRFGHGAVLGAALLSAASGLALLAGASGWLELLAAFVAIGIGWSAMGSVPYAVLGKLAPHGRGAHYTRLFGFSTVIPQVVTTLGLALFAPRYLGSDPHRIVLMGSAVMALGGVLAIVLRSQFSFADGEHDDW